MSNRSLSALSLGDLIFFNVSLYYQVILLTPITLIIRFYKRPIIKCRSILNSWLLSNTTTPTYKVFDTIPSTWTPSKCTTGLYIHHCISNTNYLLAPTIHTPTIYFIQFIYNLCKHMYTCRNTTLIKNWSGIYFSKTWLLPFDSPRHDYYLQELIEMFIIIFTFESLFTLLPSIVHPFVPIQSSPCKINISPTLLWIPFNATNFNFSTSHTHHLHMSTLPSRKYFQKMTYLHPFHRTNTLISCPVINKFQIPLFSLFHV